MDPTIQSIGANVPETRTVRFRSRVILLGASNLTFGFPLIVHQLRRWLPAPLQIYSAHGHGRSYGIWSYVGWYGMPGMCGCDMWDSLDSQPPVEGPTLALITDVGNDLIYGVDPDRIIDWVRVTMDRLDALNAKLVVTRLPLKSAFEMDAFKFELIKRVLFPGKTIGWPELKRRAILVEEMLAQTANDHGAALLSFDPEWYGIDRIHIRFSDQAKAWAKVFQAWGLGQQDEFQPSDLRERWRLWMTAKPAHWQVGGWRRCCSQPCIRWPDGSQLCMY